MSLKLLVGSRGGVWFAVGKVSVFLTACAVGSCDTETEQVAEWEERCVFLELFFFFLFEVTQGTTTICLPSLKAVLSAFLETADLSHMFIKRQGMESALPWRGVFPPLCQRC